MALFTESARRVGSLWAIWAVAVAGCHTHTAQHAPVAPPQAALPVTGRTPIEPDVSAVPLNAAPLPRPTEYRRLTAADTRLLAARNAPFADDLDRHGENDAPSHPRLHRKEARYAESSRLVRGHAADELRNRAAGDALEEFFKLAGAEGQHDLLAAAESEVRAQLAEAEKAVKAGLADRADTPTLRRRLLDLEAQEAKLDASIGMLNASLRARLNVAAGDPLPLWPLDHLRVRPDEVNVEGAVATGLHYRPDLNVLRVLAASGAGDLTDAVLSGLNPLLAKQKPTSPLVLLLHPFLKEPERTQATAAARAQAALVARERQAEAEIRAAAVSLRGYRAAVAARTLDVTAAQERVTELLARQKAGVNVTADLATARAELLKAKGELLSAAVEWHIADVKLRQAMGLLVRE